MRKRWSIKGQIALMVVAISIILTGIETGIVINSIATGRENITRELESVAVLINNNIALFCSDIMSTVENLYNSPKLQDYFTETDPMERYIISQYIQDVINATVYGNLNISSIRILQDNYTINAGGINSQQTASFFHKANLEYKFFDLVPDEAFFTRVYMNEDTLKPYVAYIRPVFGVNRYASGEDDKNHKVIYYVLYSLDSLQKYVDSLVFTVPGTEVVIEDNGTVILSNNHDLINKPIEESVSSRYGGKYQTIQRDLNIINWNVYISAPVTGIYKKSFSTLRENLVIAGMSIVIIALLAVWITRNLTSPVMKISQDINSIYGENATNYKLGTYNLEEINDIATYINSMLDRIKNANESLMKMQERLHQSVIAKKEMELAFYQMQINPHFLYNTLECMRSIGQAYNIQEIQAISSAMAQIFRYSIKKREIVNLSEELMCVADYFEIIKIRFLNKFQFESDISEEFLSLKVPKMILQPLAENAIKHGLSGNQEGGLVVITASRDDTHLYIYVSDNGQGIERYRLENLNTYLEDSGNRKFDQEKSKGVALDNINRRIKLDFGEQYGISLDSVFGKGTKVTVTLPIIE